MKKIASIVLALVLVLAMAAPAMAAETTKITITGGANGSEYAAYKLLNATNDGELYAYTLNDKYTEILQAKTGKTEQADIVAYIAVLDADGIRKFANEVYAAIKDADPAIAADYTTDNNVFEEVDQGYYLIVETGLGTNTDGTTDTYSLVMLDTAGDSAIEVATKEDTPTVEKKVEEKNDSTGDSSWGDSADYDVGDVIKYEITGTVSSKYADYKSYYYSFSDTMDKGLTYNGDAKVYVVNGDVKTEVTDQFTITTTTNDETNLANGFTATANLKELTLPEGVTIAATTEIVVEYTATLNENAVSGSEGNENKVVLEYENNPYHEGDGKPETPDKPEEPGKTPEDVNIVFTYDVIVDKVAKNTDYDENDENSEEYIALEGAGFTLYKWNSATNAWVAVGKEITGVTTFEFKKLDEGKYKLVETTVPDGYNKAADVEFEIVSTLEGEELTALTVTPADSFTVTLATGRIETSIKNIAGKILPETGGIGTTIFYVAGGLLMVGALVLLITKRKVESK